MLFPYKRIPHAMEKMHEFAEFFFLNIWCNAPNVDYDLDLFKGNPALYKIMEQLIQEDAAGQLSDTGAGSFLLNGLNEIFNEFKTLTTVEIQQYRDQFEHNNKIEDLCKNASGSIPAHYDSLNPVKVTLNTRIQKFFKGLYSSGFFDLKCVKDEIGATIKSYYRDFVRRGNGNDNDVCPFCGLQTIDGEFDPTRDAFDHYLPKGKYPFNSVNLANLCPSCNKCNSGNKLEQDPIHDAAGNRRKAFYPFGTVQPDISITATVQVSDWDKPSSNDISITLTSQNHADETTTWAEIYRIPSRYAARCCSKAGGTSWRNKVLDECQNYRLDPAEMCLAEIKTAKSSPWYEANFLKIAFLEGCQQTGMFS